MNVSAMGVSKVSDALAARQGGAAPTYLDRRFDAQARPVPDPGSTVIAHVTDPADNAALAAIPAAMRAAGLDHFWAWLPAPSYHMTLFDMLLHGARGPRWSRDLDQGMVGREADAVLTERLRGVSCQTAPRFRMANRGLAVSPAGIGVTLEGETPAEDARLRALRDLLAALTGLSARPGHADYRFHITLAYLIEWPSPAEAEAADEALAAAETAFLAAAPVFDLGPPEVCLFDDMCEFRPLFTLS